MYLPQHEQYINMIVQITDQDAKLLDLRGEKTSIWFHLRKNSSVIINALHKIQLYCFRHAEKKL